IRDHPQSRHGSWSCPFSPSFLASDWYSYDQSCTATGTRFDVQLTGDLTESLFHSNKSKPGAAIASSKLTGDLETTPVILYNRLHMGIHRAEENARMRRPRMFGNVVERFLNHTVKCGFDF